MDEGVAFDFVVQQIKDSVFAFSQELVCPSLRPLRPLRSLRSLRSLRFKNLFAFTSLWLIIF
jgi:hypothetical protein